MKGPRVGTVLIFKEGVTKADAERVLTVVAPLLEREWIDYARKANGSMDPTKPLPLPVPFIVEEFDGEDGGPVWYIP